MTENKKNRLQAMYIRFKKLDSEVSEDFAVANRLYEQAMDIIFTDPDKAEQMLELYDELYTFARKKHRDALAEMRRLGWILQKENYFNLTF